VREERAMKGRCILRLTESHDLEVAGCACGHGNNPESIFVYFFKEFIVLRLYWNYSCFTSL
jgi:hypothetical protein